MGIRIQPLDIDIPEDEPFKYDLLGRREVVEVLTQILGAVDGPCVMAVDAPWGSGKSTFLKIWSRHLRNNEFPVVEFNAWENDFAEDPFVALSSEVTIQINDTANTSLVQKIAATRNAAAEMALRTIPGVVRIATAGLLDIAPIMEKEIGEFLTSAAKDRLARYQEARQSVEGFRTSLQDLVATASSSCNGRPLVVVIDELDRCRPSYAVELLEVAKHLFSVDHIVFVLAINRSELAHSVKAIYGADFDSPGYLRRFFDIDFQLPEPSRDGFIKATLEATHFATAPQTYPDQATEARAREEMVLGLLVELLGSSDLSLRAIAQAIHRLGLVLASLSNARPALWRVATVAVILRALDEDLYHKFRAGQVTDLQVADQLLRQPWARPEERNTWVRRMFEANIIMAAREIEFKSNRWRGPFGIPETPLFKQYSEIAEANRPGDAERSPDTNRASEVLQWVRDLTSMPPNYDIGFLDSVHRIELLSANLTEG